MFYIRLIRVFDCSMHNDLIYPEGENTGLLSFQVLLYHFQFYSGRSCKTEELHTRFKPLFVESLSFY